MKRTFIALSFVFLITGQVLSAETFGEKIKRGFENATEKTVDAGRSAGRKVNDASITSEIKAALLADERIVAYKINVDTRHRIVYLKGSVPNNESRVRAIRTARNARGVRKVVDQLRIHP